APCRDVSRHQSTRAIAEKHSTFGQQLFQKRNEMFLAARMKGAGSRQTLRHMRGCADPQWHVVDECPLSQTTMEELVMIGVGNGPQMGLAVNQQPDGHTPVMQAIDEAGRTINGVDNPHTTGGKSGAAALLPEKTIFRKMFG